MLTAAGEISPMSPSPFPSSGWRQAAYGKGQLSRNRRWHRAARGWQPAGSVATRFGKGMTTPASPARRLAALLLLTAAMVLTGANVVLGKAIVAEVPVYVSMLFRGLPHVEAWLAGLTTAAIPVTALAGSTLVLAAIVFGALAQPGKLRC